MSSPDSNRPLKKFTDLTALSSRIGASRLLTESLPLARATSDRWLCANILTNLGSLAREQGQSDDERLQERSSHPGRRVLGSERLVGIADGVGSHGRAWAVLLVMGEW